MFARNESTAPAHSTFADAVRQGVVVIATVVTIAFNGISQAIPLGGRTSADVSNQFTTYFTPANFAFSIWGVIYLLLWAFAIYQALPAQRTNAKAREIGWLYVFSCVLNCLWIALFQFEQIALSVLVIVLFLLTLIAIYLRLDTGHSKATSAEHWLLHLPFSVYLGWLSVATIADVSVLGVSQNWGDLFGIAAPTWAAIMLVVATLIGLIMAVTRRDVGFVLVLIWAFSAIVSKQSVTPVVATTALITAAVLLLVLAASLVFDRRRAHPLIPSEA